MSSWVYLTLSINGLAYTVNAFKPAKRNRAVFLWSFFASWITIELAWFHLIFQVLMTVVFARAGAFRRTPGRIGLGIALLSWAGLAQLVRESLAARQQIADALQETDYQPVPRRQLPVRTTKNIEFDIVTTDRSRSGRFRRPGRVATRTTRLKMDVTRPATPPEPGTKRPAIIQIHGGGWVIGDKREQGLPLLKLLASQGWVGFNVNYRLSPGVAFPDHLIDVKRSLAWIREHADEFDIDPSFIAVTGGSAGGHLTALMALTPNDPAYQPGFEDADTTLQAAVPFYGVYDFTNRNGAWPEGNVSRFIEPVVMKAKLADEPERFAQASPLDQVRADAPPFFIIHGDRDTLAPVEDARDFAQRLEEVSTSDVRYLELTGAQHAFDVFPSIRCNASIAAVDRFLTHTYEQHQAAAGEADALAFEGTTPVTVP
jgi:acetyl esterase/lipase